MRFVVTHPKKQELPDLKVETDKLNRLKAWLQVEIENAMSARAPQESLWREMMRMYEGVPKNPIKNTPIENAPNMEVTLGAIACDAIYAQMLDLIYNIAPVITCRATKGDPTLVNAVKSLQTFADHLVNSDINLRPASEHAILDDVQLGSGFYYIPWVDVVKKGDVNKVIWKGPRIFSVPIEDCLAPGGAYEDIQSIPWFAMRTWMRYPELEKMKKYRGWNIDGFAPCGYKDWVRTRREALARTGQLETKGFIYETWQIYVYYDIDDDGEDEDLLIEWDRTSRNIAKITYNPYDNRPFEKMCYQLRSHLFYGMGAMEMLRPYQEEMTELHNQQTLNVMLANCRIWIARSGEIPDGQLTFWPNKVIEMSDPAALKPEQMGDVYPSIFQAQATIVSLAERRVGINDLSTPRPSAVLGSRTPGITALSLLQQVNKRFTPAFDSARFATAGAVRQCLYRFQERLLDGRYSAETEQFLKDLLGDQAGTDCITLLKHPNFDDAVMVELTASSASINRDADRQNAVMLVNILVQYYDRALQLATLAANPMTPPEVREVAKKIAGAAGECIDRTIRTFDQIRDPATFIIDMNNELDQLQGLSEQGLLGLRQMMMAGQAGMQPGQGAEGGGAEPPQNPLANGNQASV